MSKTGFLSEMTWISLSLSLVEPHLYFFSDELSWKLVSKSHTWWGFFIFLDEYGVRNSKSKIFEALSWSFFIMISIKQEKSLYSEIGQFCSATIQKKGYRQFYTQETSAFSTPSIEKLIIRISPSFDLK